MDTVKVYFTFGILFICLAQLYEARSVDCEVICKDPDTKYSDYCECLKLKFPFRLNKRGRHPFRYGKREFTGLPLYDSNVERLDKRGSGRGRKPFRYGKRDFSDYPYYENFHRQDNYDDVLDLVRKSIYDDY